ncbi:MAG TPA: hypothetical protein ENK46_08430 [Flavobacteriia bacterium]|nr:hypothetical protein [Flavobacteriia bacterium]
MLRIRYSLLLFICFSLMNCKSENARYHLDKRFWDTNDYEDIIMKLKYGIKPDEKLPSFSDPETRMIVEKLTDEQNFKVVLEDSELGIKHKNKVASDFFRLWKDMNTIYRKRDRKDNFVYDRELLKVYHFGLGLQLLYFKLGNDELVEDADDPNDSSTQTIINSNVKTLISNFNNYLDQINDEKSFSEEGKKLLSKGLDKYFTELVNQYPKANYNEMLKKIELMEKKSHSETVITSLKKIKMLIESKREKKPSNE